MGDILIPSSLPENIVTVDQIDEQNGVYRVTWTPIPGVSVYKIYVSPTPLTPNLYATVTTGGTFDFTQPPWTPQDVTYYFWVSYIGYSGETFINTFPAYTGLENPFSADKNPFSQDSINNSLIYCGDDLAIQYYFEEIRRRNAAMMENDGEYFYLYLRKWSGRACTCLRMSDSLIDDSDAALVGKKTEIDDVNLGDPDYQPVGRCPNCFGTGIYGGYFPKIRIRARYGNLPPRNIAMQQQGLDFRHDFDSWTLWHPKLHKLDMLHRIGTGDRFVVDNIAQSEWRGQPLHQEMKLINKPKTDILYDVNDETIALGVSTGEADVDNNWYPVWQ